MHSTHYLPPVVHPSFASCDPWDPSRPFVLTLTGTSGSGKGDLVRELERRGMTRIISTTTRPMRAGEVQGGEYHFVEARSFATTFCEGGFAECTRHAGHWYGVTRATLADGMAGGHPMCVVIDPRGVRRMRVLAQEHGWRIQSLFLNQPRHCLAQTLVRRGPTDLRSDGRVSTAIMESLKVQTGWFAELRWDVVIHTAVGPSTAGALATRLIEIARPPPKRVPSSVRYPSRRLVQGAQ